ncbi:uncharacterized protein LOC124163943 [Ischnura elegans]|uniref:uncharacterized protein LOC124163943 n=1 Tax=Ischnura elegans TaxID=197161 RepID=UPI001ED8A28D|nr:uncharacterized protein LOC124163943 [Ischnura elegans]
MKDLSSYVNREALQQSLHSLTGRKDVQLLDGYEVERATINLEGFTSLVLRVKLSYHLPGDEDTKSHVFFVKAMTPVYFVRVLLKTADIFTKELLYFTHVVPLMSEVSGGKVHIPLPVCYHTTDEKGDIAFYMEDLLHSGYRPADRCYLSDGFDYAHSSLVMKGLGKLHALSLAAENSLDSGKGTWSEKYPGFLKEFLHYVPSSELPPSSMHNSILAGTQVVKELCRELEGLPKEAEASGALDEVMEGAWPTLCRLKETPADTRGVLIHGDFWANNMMFRYAENAEMEEPVDVKFFDLQMTKVCHPGIDLLHFMYVNTRKSFRDENFSTLIDVYYESLVETLELLGGGLPPFTLTDFKSDVMGKYRPFGIILATVFCPWVMLGDDFFLSNAAEMSPKKMEKMLNVDAPSLIKALFHSDLIYRRNAEEILREFVNMALPNGLESVNSSPLLS